MILKILHLRKGTAFRDFNKPKIIIRIQEELSRTEIRSNRESGKCNGLYLIDKFTPLLRREGVVPDVVPNQRHENTSLRQIFSMAVLIREIIPESRERGNLEWIRI